MFSFSSSNHIKNHLNLAVIIFFGILIRIICNLVFQQFYIFDDEWGYIDSAKEITKNSENFQFVDNQYKNYIAILYFLSDGFWLAKLLNIVYSCLTAIFASSIIKLITDDKYYAWYTYLLFLFFPPFIIISGTLLKESMIIFLSIGFIYYVMSKNPYSLLLGFFFSILLIFARQGYILIIIPVFILYFLNYFVFAQNSQSYNVKKKHFGFAFGIVFITVFVGLYFGGTPIRYIISFFSLGYEGEYSGIRSMAENTIRNDRSAFYHLLVHDKFANIYNPINLFLSIMRLVFSPHPLTFIYNFNIYGFLQSAFVLCLYPFVGYYFWGLRKSIDNINVLILSIFSISVFVISAISSISTMNAMFRYSWVFYPFFLLVSIYGIFKQNKEKIKYIYLFWGLSVYLSLVLYFHIKSLHS